MTIGLPELSARVETHTLGPEQDRAARLAVCHLMGESGESPEQIAEVLQMLALYPGTEHKRYISGTDLTTMSKEPGCLPKSPALSSYVPN